MAEDQQGDMFPDQPLIDDDSPLAAPSFAASTAATAPASATPNMIGDLFASGFLFNNVSVPIAAGDRRFKLADANSPLPQDRVFFNYHHFRNALIDADAQDVDVNRYTFGIEKMFLDGMTSVEVRIPFASGLDATQSSSRNDEGTEFGNISLTFKLLLAETQNLSISAGLGLTLPTATDVEFHDSFGSPIATLDNEAYYLQPFLGIIQRRDRFFSIYFFQADFDANGNTILTGSGLSQENVIQDQSLLFMDAAWGYWLYRDPCTRITGIAPVIELHYTTTMQNADNVSGSGFVNPDNRIDLLNLVAGVHFEINGNSTLTVMGGAPLRTQEADLDARPTGGSPTFDGEFGIRYNLNY